MVEAGVEPEQARVILNADEPSAELYQQIDELSKEKAQQVANLQKTMEVIDYIDAVIQETNDPKMAVAALRSLISHSSRGLENRLNIEHLTHHYERIYQKELADLIAEFRTSASRLAKEVFTGSAREQDRVAEKLFIDSVFGRAQTPKVDSKNTEMDALADKWLATVERMRQDFNEAAGFEAIEKLEGWNMPQSWDAAKIKDQFKTADEFADWMIDRVDLQRMGADRVARKFNADVKKWRAKQKKSKKEIPPPKRPKDTALTKQEAREVLKTSYDTIISDGYSKLEMAAASQTRKGTPYRRHAHSRVLHLKDADSWSQVNDMLGRGERVFDILMSHVNSMANDTATMEIMPPRAFEAAKLYIEKGLQQKVSRHTDDMYKVAAGRTESGNMEDLAAVTRGARDILISTRLDKAMVSAIADTGANFTFSKHLGLSYGKVLRTQIKMMWGNSLKDRANQAGLGADAWVQNASSNMRMGESSFTGWTGHLAQGSMRFTMLSSWTHAGRAAFQQELLSEISRLSDTPFDELPQNLQDVMGAEFGLKASDWDAFRGQEKVNGYLPVDNPAAKKVNGILTTYANRAVPTPDARVRAITTLGYSDTALEGALARLGFSFQAFPLTIMSNHWMFLANNRSLTSKMNRVQYTGMLLGTMTAMGIVAQLAYDASEGKDMRRLESAEDWGRLLQEGYIRGGGLSLAGDYFGTEWNRYGNSGPVEKIFNSMFPVKDLAEDVLTISPTGALLRAVTDDNYTMEKYLLDAAKVVDKNTPQPWFIRPVTKEAAEFLKEGLGGATYAKERRRKERDERKKYGRSAD